ncbi:MAG: UDP-N-acetylmuramate--L-alanine ligase [bacterium]|nr:UDP-N-acetylmuramate--L-alanine ligase [bacterium]
MKDNNFLKNIRNIHFVGIGGIGVSAIARMMLAEGKRVSGSDASWSLITRELKKLGAVIYKGHNARNLASDTDLVVHTTAAAKNNPELLEAKKLKIPVLKYSQMLGLVSKDKHTVAVAGTHGKTTTTAMIAKILIDAKLNPSVIVGSLLKKENSNFIPGKGNLFVCEACEYNRAFLDLSPNILVITNIEEDHLDYYKDLRDIQSAFSELAEKLGKDDFLVCDLNDKNLEPVARKTKAKIIDYSKIRLPPDNLRVPGAHNIKNGKAALGVAKILKIRQSEAIKSLGKFSGVWRRFERKGRSKEGVLIYDDYAHHPTEVRAALRGAREKFKNKKIFCVFQPHLFSRTRLLMDDFAKSFGDADEVIVADIYAAREKDDKKVHAKDLVDKIKNYNARHIKSFGEIKKFLKKNAKKGDVIITMGAGDIFKVGESMLE